MARNLAAPHLPHIGDQTGDGSTFACHPAGPEADVTSDEPKVADAPKVVEIGVIAYAEDCILSGRLPMATERLSDLLNAHDEFEFVNVRVEDLLGNSPIETRDVVVHRAA